MSGQPSPSASRKAPPAPSVSGRNFLPARPLLWVNFTPEPAVMSVNLTSLVVGLTAAKAVTIARPAKDSKGLREDPPKRVMVAPALLCGVSPFGPPPPFRAASLRIRDSVSLPRHSFDFATCLRVLCSSATPPGRAAAAPKGCPTLLPHKVLTRCLLPPPPRGRFSLCGTASSAWPVWPAPAARSRDRGSTAAPCC